MKIQVNKNQWYIKLEGIDTEFHISGESSIYKAKAFFMEFMSRQFDAAILKELESEKFEL